MIIYLALGFVLVSSLLETENYKKVFRFLKTSCEMICIPFWVASAFAICSMILAWPLVALDVCVSRMINNAQ